MKLLILGGTAFLGRHLVEAALERGHEITLFNRGQRNPGLYPHVEQLRGDRDGELEALRGRRWDAVIDTSGYFPRIVRKSAQLLADQVEHYTFVSSISVYASMAQPNSEASPVGRMKDEAVEQITGETYGPLKALCEEAAEGAMPGRVLNIRPGLIVGSYDPSDRFTYWPQRVAKGGEVLAPGRPDRPVQIIHARDLAEWNLRMVETGQTGVYNATGPAYRLTMGEVLETCRDVSGSDARFTWVDEPFLKEQGVGAWIEMPLWIPEDGPAAMHETNISKAVAAGLTFRPLAEIVRDTLEWDRSRPDSVERRAGMKPEREAEVLAAFHRRA